MPVTELFPSDDELATLWHHSLSHYHHGMNAFMHTASETHRAFTRVKTVRRNDELPAFFRRLRRNQLDSQATRFKRFRWKQIVKRAAADYRARHS